MFYIVIRQNQANTTILATDMDGTMADNVAAIITDNVVEYVDLYQCRDQVK